MRQAVPTIIAAFSLAFSSLAAAAAPQVDAAATIAQAKRLIDAKDYTPASNLLEDLLPDVELADRPTVLELLRQSYEAMASEAKAAGREREAAHFLDNLAIIARSSGTAASTVPKAEKPRKPVSPEPPISSAKSAGALAPAPSPSPAREAVAGDSEKDRTPSLLPEPAPLSEPMKMPVAEPELRLPGPIASPDTVAPSRSAETVPSPRPTDDPIAGSAARPAAALGSMGENASRSASAIIGPDAAARANGLKPPSEGPSLEEGDRFFAAGKYSEAGKCYNALAGQQRLPAHRIEHWAYCRMVEVARKINLRPRSPREWDEIEAEIVSVQRLSPNIWYGEYLRNKVAEVRRTGGRRAPAKADTLVVRGTAPEESRTPPASPARRLPRLAGNARGGVSAEPAAETPAASPEVFLSLPGDASPSPAPKVVDEPKTNDRALAENARTPASPATRDVAVVRANHDAVDTGWQVYETANFRIHHRDARLAEAAGQAAETARAAQAKRWSSPALQKSWAPACDIYLYPTGKAFARDTKQPEDSPGFSTMECTGSRVITRRVNLRADHPQMVAAILPHEVTHVVLADLFTTQQIPRWADEGIAVLAEPRAEQELRAAELREPLESGHVFDLSKLMAMDYPDPKDWGLYYAQSVSLTRFLVEQAPPRQFIRFVQVAQRDGMESALRVVYQISGVAELQSRWTEYARQQVGPVREASRDPRRGPADSGVQ